MVWEHGLFDFAGVFSSISVSGSFRLWFVNHWYSWFRRGGCRHDGNRATILTFFYEPGFLSSSDSFRFFH